MRNHKADYPAFCTPINDNGIEEGMTLRDYFAAKIAGGDAAAGTPWSPFPDGEDDIKAYDKAIKSRAALYYRIADAMLVEREK